MPSMTHYITPSAIQEWNDALDDSGLVQDALAAEAVRVTRQLLEDHHREHGIGFGRLSISETFNAVTALSHAADSLGLSGRSDSAPQSVGKPVTVALPDIGDAWLDD